MANNNDLGCLSYFENMHKKELDTLRHLALKNGIIRDMLFIIETGMMTPVEALTGCVHALSVINDDLLKRLLEFLQTMPSPTAIVPKSEDP